MKINRKRAAISQSMDLFIIIAAVLGVGGIVSASVYNLVNSASSNASVAVVGASVVGGYSTGGAVAAPSAIAITIKNNGGNSITCTSTTCSVTLAGTSEGTGTPSVACAPTTCLTSTPSSGPTGWIITPATAGIPLQFTAGATGFTLAPGAQTSFVVNGLTGTLGTSPSMPAHGGSVTLNVIFGTASAQVTVVAQ